MATLAQAMVSHEASWIVSILVLSGLHSTKHALSTLGQVWTSSIEGGQRTNPPQQRLEEAGPRRTSPPHRGLVAWALGSAFGLRLAWPWNVWTSGRQADPFNDGPGATYTCKNWEYADHRPAGRST